MFFSSQFLLWSSWGKQCFGYTFLKFFERLHCLGDLLWDCLARMQLDDVRRSSGVTGNHRFSNRDFCGFFSHPKSVVTQTFSGKVFDLNPIPIPVDPDRSMGHSRIRRHLSCRRMCILTLVQASKCWTIHRKSFGQRYVSSFYQHDSCCYKSSV